MLRLFTTTAAAALLASTAQAEFTLHILHTNDIHSRVESINRFDSTCDAEGEAEGECFGGMARIKTAMDAKRAELGDNVIVLDAGDVFQGSLFFTTYEGAAEAEFMNGIGYHVMSAGNHEFNNGPEGFASFIDLVDFPVISGNLDVSASEALNGKLGDTQIVEVAGERIGIVSALATDTVETSSPGPNVIFSDEIESLTADVAALEAQGVEKIIALTHVGARLDFEIAEAVPGIDVVVGGHSHTLFSNDDEGTPAYPTMVGDTPVVQAYAYSKYLGHLTVTFDDDGAVTMAEGDPMLLDASVEPDADMLARIGEMGEPIAELQARVVAETTEFIEGDRTVCRAMECPMGNLVADAMLDRVRDQGIQIAIQNGGGLRASIDAGEVTMGEVLTVLPFQNTLATFQLEGADVVAALENGVSRLADGAGRFPQVSGLKYSFDADAEPGSRISDVMVMEGDGFVPLEMDKVYGVVSNNYMRGGGDGYDVFATDGMNAYDYGPGLEYVVADYLAANMPYTPYTDGRITAE
jgi:5'-nucleotidase